MCFLSLRVFCANKIICLILCSLLLSIQIGAMGSSSGYFSAICWMFLFCLMLNLLHIFPVQQIPFSQHFRKLFIIVNVMMTFIVLMLMSPETIPTQCSFVKEFPLFIFCPPPRSSESSEHPMASKPFLKVFA